MARRFSGTNFYLENTSAILTAVPISYSAMIYPISFTNAGTICSVGATSAGGDNFSVGTVASTGAIQMVAQNGGTVSQTSTLTAPLNLWSHIGVVFSSNVLRSVYLAGANKATSTTSVTPSSSFINRTNIGTLWSAGSRSNFFAGFIAEVGFWNAALSDAEILLLSQGVKPCFVRPQSLTAYYPLSSPGTTLELDFNPNQRSRFNLTVSGASVALSNAVVRNASSFLRRNRKIVSLAKNVASPAILFHM